MPFENVAVKLFGSVEDAIGKVLQIIGDFFIVTGVIENQPEQSSFRMEALIPFEYMEPKLYWLRGWNSNSTDTYIRFKAVTNIEELEQKFPAFITQYNDTDDIEKQWRLYLQPVRDIHLR